ncbi:related to COX18-mitochondrial inner membrane protein required for membrane insertion of C-terminus of Cox2p [Sporisorium reilianum f. sp. reilianum]|uniref:Related to COX18-mitochondrial inner membrane protein required for membrane insertion of C-terminus of Cox2p n=1 Tax=Sporisorium reilianum f. sp. reilianum TaxID=72559 RepID=A0A2N8U892_9BASI|nr:related to COX18-mitochondrial inner membrane protein required for membrane insertion of C-terminus of Cox2p [Sporisorium reilianum f. sp. reilianum]
MASSGVFRIAAAGIRTRAAVLPSVRSSFSSTYRLAPRSHRGFASSTATFSSAPSTSQLPVKDAVSSAAEDSTTAATQAVADSDVVAGGFEFLQPWVPTINNLADTMHLSGPYAHALSIFILAFAVRTAVTLPMTLWQRNKTRKLTEKVLPEWEIMKEHIPLAVRARCRRAGMSYEAFEAEAQKELKAKLAELLRKHNASPLPAFVGPAMFTIPVFLLMTALLRQCALDPTSPLSSEVLPWWSPSPELAQQFKASTAILADRGFDEAAIAKLRGTMGGPTLVDKDSTMIGPLSFGMLTLANTELNSWSRRSMAKIRAVTSGKQDAAARTAQKLLADKPAATPAQPMQEDDDEPPRARIITNALRVLAIAFIPIACQTPGVLVIYWLSSGIYTLIQNSILAVMDRRSEVIKAARKQQLLQQPR